MRNFDKAKRIEKANILLENRSVSNSSLITESNEIFNTIEFKNLVNTSKLLISYLIGDNSYVSLKDVDKLIFNISAANNALKHKYNSIGDDDEFDKKSEDNPGTQFFSDEDANRLTDKNFQ